MNQGPPNIFKQLGARTKSQSKPNSSMKGKCETFSAHEQRSKVCSVYLAFKFHQNRCS